MEEYTQCASYISMSESHDFSPFINKILKFSKNSSVFHLIQRIA